MTQNSIHIIADKMGIKWDGDKDFMSWCQTTVGKKHLDDMSELELTTIYTKIKNGDYNKPLSEKWSAKYKKSINCSRPKGFSQKAHCAGRKKRKKMYKEIEEAKEIMKMMEDVFGHRVTTWTPKDTAMLKNKISQPTNDQEKEEFVSMVEPLMKKKSTTAKGLDKELRKFIDLDTRIGSQDYQQTIDLDDYKKKSEKIVFKSKEKKSEEDKNKK